MTTVDNGLSAKYSGKVFMYTEYPTKGTWSREFGHNGYVTAWRDFLKISPWAPMMLYAHMPYCPAQCLFCTCTTIISQNYDDIRAYMATLAKEIGLLEALFESIGTRPNFREIHLGGGTPTYLKPAEFEALLAKIATIVNFDQLSEFSIEIDPRHTKEDGMKYYADCGINRVSFGIQDFDLKIQESVNRVQPAFLTERLIRPEIRKLFTHGVNFDIICGLPHQTPASMKSTMQKVVAMSPDRVCFNYMDMAPAFQPHQLLMPLDAIPQHRQRREIFLAGLEVLEAAGYVRAGFDHFAKPDDSVARAQEKGKMAWNTLGVTRGDCVDVAGIGMSSISRIGEDCYSQSFYELDRYTAAVEAGVMPVFRGTRLSFNDRVRRHVINSIRNYFRIDFSDFARQFGLWFPQYFYVELLRLQELVDDGLVVISDNEITVTEPGRQFANHAAKIFDSY